MSLVSSCVDDMLLASKCLFKECERTNVQQVDLVAYGNFNVSLFVDVFWKNNHGQGVESFHLRLKKIIVLLHSLQIVWRKWRSHWKLQTSVRTSTWYLSLAAGIFSRSATEVLVRWATDVGR